MSDSIKAALIDLDTRRYVPSLAAAVARERSSPHRIYADTAPPHDTASTPAAQSTEQVGTTARTDDGTVGDLTISLSDAAFLVALGVALTLAVELAVFVAWAGWAS